MVDYTEFSGDNLHEHITTIQANAQEETMGVTFICEFDEDVTPEELIESVFNPNDKYKSIGFSTKLRDDEPYYKINSIISIGGGTSAKLNCELCPEWMRVYIRGEEDTDALIEFFNTFSTQYSHTIKIAEPIITPSE